jgi:hypothetical protein
MIGKWANINGKFTRVLLEEKEIKKVMKDLLEFNTKQLGIVIKKLNDEEYNASENPILIRILADKQMVSSYTVLLNALEEKVTKLKEPPKKDDEDFKKLVQKQLEKVEKEEKPKSRIEQAFESDDDYVQLPGNEKE